MEVHACEFAVHDFDLRSVLLVSLIGYVRLIQFSAHSLFC